jgi:hypothetical protein
LCLLSMPEMFSFPGCSGGAKLDDRKGPIYMSELTGIASGILTSEFLRSQ